MLILKPGKSLVLSMLKAFKRAAHMMVKRPIKYPMGLICCANLAAKVLTSGNISESKTANILNSKNPGFAGLAPKRLKNPCRAYECRRW
jgi:hypothetical protein